uniref:Uncharacterized protein n=1 Tax=Angiostrongylus cantonensis TaxID=6313 RepID=A0A0K0DPD9_ANGCA
MVVAWRRGIVCSHEGLPISDELYLSNELISILITEFIQVYLMTTVQMTVQMIALLFRTLCALQTEIRKRRGRAPHVGQLLDVSHFLLINMVQKGTSESKTGPKTTEQTPTSDWKYIKWRELTVATKLPMLSAEILNFEAVFHRNDTLKYSTLF